MYGISVDLPFVQNVWIEQHDPNFPILSDGDHKIIQAYDIVCDEMYDMIETAPRSAFVIDGEGTIRYRWVRYGDNPKFEVFTSTVRDEVAAAARL